MNKGSSLYKASGILAIIFGAIMCMGFVLLFPAVIGIAMILSLSTGFQNYIDKIQEDTLTSYPLTVMRDTADVMSALLSLAAEAGEETGDGVVKEQQVHRRGQWLTNFVMQKKKIKVGEGK